MEKEKKEGRKKSGNSGFKSFRDRSGNKNGGFCMIFKTTITQTDFLLKKRGAIGVFYFLLIMVFSNFIGNVLYFQGRDIAEMIQPMKLLLLSYNRTDLNATNTLLLIQLYPFLVVFPAGFCWQEIISLAHH